MLTEVEKKLVNYGIIVGELGALAEFNTKANNIYDFNFDRLPKSDVPEVAIKKRLECLTKNFHLLKIDNQDAFQEISTFLKEKWFFQYQNENETDYLIDNSNSFNMFFSDYQEKYVKEFVDFLLQKFVPTKICKVKLYDLNHYYASDYDHYFFECEDAYYYYLELCVSD